MNNEKDHCQVDCHVGTTKHSPILGRATWETIIRRLLDEDRTESLQVELTV